LAGVVEGRSDAQSESLEHAPVASAPASETVPLFPLLLPPHPALSETASVTPLETGRSHLLV
jgi:hypothetical protein